jgi:hypothetical protein
MIRLIAESSNSMSNLQKKAANALSSLFAGDAGVLVVKELQKNPELNLMPWVSWMISGEAGQQILASRW